jgi:hypothetical protein
MSGKIDGLFVKMQQHLPCVIQRGFSEQQYIKTHQNVCSFKLIDCSFWTNASEFFKWCLDCQTNGLSRLARYFTRVYVGEAIQMSMDLNDTSLWIFGLSLIITCSKLLEMKHTKRQTDKQTWPPHNAAFCTLVQITHPVIRPIKNFTPCLLICLYDIVLSHKGNPTFTNATYLHEGMIKCHGKSRHIF